MPRSQDLVPSTERSRRVGRGLILAALIVVSSIVLFRQIDGSLLDWDEAIYAEQAREMLVLGDWLTPHWNFEPQFEKPPLILWLLAVTAGAAGPSGVVFRGSVAVFGVGTVLMTFLLGERLFSRTAGVLAALSLICFPMFQNLSRLVMLDVPVTFFSSWALLAFFTGYERGRFSPQLGIATGLAILSKGFPGALPLLTALIFLALRRRSLLRERSLWTSLAWSLGVLLPWHLAMLYRHGQVFLTQYFVRNLFHRAVTPLEGHQESPLYYLGVLQDGLSSYWLPTLAALLWLVARVLRRQAEDPEVLILVASLVPFAAFSSIQTKLPWYAAPLLPVLALALGRLLESFATRAREPFPQVVTWGWLSLTIYGALADRGRIGLWALPLTLLAAAALFSIGLAMRRIRFPEPSPTVFSSLIAFSLLACAFSWPPIQDLTRGVKLIGECVRSISNPSDSVAAFGVDGPALLFYGRRRIDTVESSSMVSGTTAADSPALLVCRPDFCESLDPGGWHPVYTVGLARLFSRVPVGDPCEHPPTPAEPLVAHRLAPTTTRAGVAFNEDPDSSSVLRVESSGASDSTLILFDGHPVPTVVASCSVLIGYIDRKLLSRPGVVRVRLQDRDRLSEALDFVISDDDGTDG